MFYLDSDRLRVEIANPAKLRGQTTRFDHSGYITEVTLDNNVRFCASEPRNMKSPSSGGRGLCSEYRFDASGEAKLGEAFPKFGVGLLRKPNEHPYRIDQKYECEPYEVEVETKSNSICFTTLPRSCMGYAAKTRRIITVEHNKVIMEMYFENTGSKAIVFQEYCHNFLSLDGMALGEAYRLQLKNIHNLRSKIERAPRSMGAFIADGDTVGIAKHIPSTASFRMERTDFPIEDSFSWHMEHASAQIAVIGKELYQPAEMAVWGCDHILCPECVFSAEVIPNSSCHWKREWIFEQFPRK